MRNVKTYKQLFESNQHDTFDLIRDYINDFCDSLDLELYPNDNKDKIYTNTKSNGILVWRFLDSRWEKTDEVSKYHHFIIEMRIKESFRLEKSEKIRKLIDWLIERVDDSEIIEKNTNLKFISNPVPTFESRFRQYEIIFDVMKKVL
jgi:hypothetical protein